MSSPNDKKMKKTTLNRSGHSGEVGVPSKNQGRPNKSPPEFSKACATHATMIQLSGEDEALVAHMSATIQALDHKYAAEGVHIILLLPNVTDTTSKITEPLLTSYNYLIVLSLCPRINPWKQHLNNGHCSFLTQFMVACVGVRSIGKR